ncbi:TPA: hypothetical protein RG862_000299 [Enterobacter ludwigii]|uniref:hypothetical protein n=1 Tax=Enterobacter ludwigii TaxID=299767 RepID=UPI0028138451|nr:hypothetical protein [Enterobacter ludwigii]
MGFPSPASDYVEQQLSPVVLCNIGVDSRVLETDIGFAVPCVKTCEGDVLLILSDWRTQFCRLMGKALITDDGEVIEGAALAEVEVLGVATFFINRVKDDDYTII